ncbi:DUF3014 domain-containing protein [Diaphorobacter sp.]|uniref:DUF3014 domain-containing protein n=1 Tax=Diaphorobacter sp. TaxID=1934310 RepID=UPI0028AC4784|nr:DUF3014 domain-containing protein [Diaphorobacter sp.]
MDQGQEPISRQIHRDSGSGGAIKVAAVALVVAALGYGGWSYMKRSQAPTVPAEVVPADAAIPPETLASAASEPAALEDYPLQAQADDKGNPPLAADATTAFENEVTQWLGKERILRFVAIDGLAQRVVATIDNLPRSQAASRLWPLHPVGGRMAVQQTNSGLQIAPENAARYDDVVGFVSGIDASRAVAVYKHVYPVLQHSYEELGYPGKSFNNRLVAVIDHLLATPEPAQPLALHLVKVESQAAAQQPWLRYEYADAQLEKMSAGQKILLRMGPENSRRIKAQLRAVRSGIASGG